MPVSKRRPKKKVRSPKKTKESDDLIFVKSPFADVPRKELIEGLIEVGMSYQEDYSSALARVRHLIRSFDVLQIIASLSVYGLFGGVTEHETLTSSYKEEFLQSHVELVQALALQIPEIELSSTPATPNIIQELFELLPKLGQAFHLRRLATVKEKSSTQEQHQKALQEHLRIHTQAVRNWGYSTQVIAMTKRLLEPLNPYFQESLSIAPTEIIDIFDHLIRRTEQRVTERFQKYKKVFTAPRIETMIEEYYKVNTHITSDPEDLIEYVLENKFSREQVMSYILSHSDLLLSCSLTFSVEEISAEMGIEEDAIFAALDRLSLSYGSLAEIKPEHLFLNNPVWTKPLINVGNGTFFCAMPQVFFSFIFPIFNEMFQGHEKMSNAYQLRRSRFLEDKISEIFSTAFSDYESFAGYTWNEDDRKYENDLLIKVDTHLIIVEAKSGAISWQALRGAPDRGKRHVEDLLLAPSVQSLRLASRIHEAQNNNELRSSLLPDFPFALDRIGSVLRLSVTLEDFASIQANLNIIKAAGWIPEEHKLAPCIQLADLETVFDLLETSSQKIHYLKRRAELEANMKYTGDEMDLLGFYFETGFNIGDAEFDGQFFQLTGMSSKIDEYHSTREKGIERKKPKQKMTNWWRDICSRIESRKFYQWSDVSNILLGFSYTEQQKAEKHFKKIKKNVQKNWRVSGHLCSTAVTPSKRKSDALVLYAFRENEKERRLERMENIASRVFSSPHVFRCLCVGVNIDQNEYPYSTIAVFFRGEK